MKEWYAKLFYGWKLVIIGSVINSLLGGLIQHSFGAYFATLQEEKGWSKTALSGAYTMMPIEGAFMGPIMGWAIDRIGPRRMMTAGIVIFGLGFMLLSQIDTLGSLYAAIFVIAVGASLCGHFPMNVLVIHWFEKKRARALSSVTLGMAAGGAMVPVVAWAMHAFGWRWTAFGSGVLILAVGLPLCRKIIGRPSDIGETVDGLPPAVVEPGKPRGHVQPDVTVKDALRSSPFWLISLGHGFALFAVTAVNVHAITHIKEHMGYTVAQASVLITLVIACQVGGIFLGWVIGDRWDKRYIAGVCMFVHMVGLLLLAYAVNTFMLVAFAILHGGAWGLRGPFMQALRADYFGRREIGMIIGISSMIIVIGQIGGPMVAGGLADLTGSYQTGFTVLALLAGAGSMFFFLMKSPAAMARALKADHNKSV
jgi:MFS family permease